jgi:hypothetical protein
MRRGIGLTLTGIGAFLLAFGLLMRYWVPGEVLKFPLNEYQVISLSGKDITYFSAPLLHEFTDVTATFTKTVDGDVPSGSSSTAVWGSFTAIEDTKDNIAIQFLSQRSAFNRRTGVLFNCCGANIGGNSKVQQTGQGFVFPAGTQHKTYELFDPTLLATVPVQFAGTATVDGLAVDKFTEQVQNRRFGEQTLPGPLVGEPAQATLTLPEQLTADNTYWVDPATGSIVEMTLNQTVALQGAKPTEKLVLLGGTFTETPASVQASVTAARAQRPKIQLIQTTIPVIGILLGLLGLVAGIALVLRSPEPWAPAYDDDEVENLAR